MMALLEKGSTVINGATGKKERIGRLVRMHADRREDVDSIGAGDIGAILGLKVATTGETLCAGERPVVLEEIILPCPGRARGHRAEDQGRSGPSVRFAGQPD